MSAFLGPIHFWLYNKIKIQNEIVEDILSFAENNNLIPDLRKNLYEKYADGDLKPLEEVIDTNNIHGWLQGRVIEVESKLAVSVTEILKNSADKFDELKDIFRSKGAEVSPLNNNSTLQDVFKAVNDTLLDGMPCDRANEVVSQEDDNIIWKRNVCVHEDYWNASDGDIKNYYLLREEFIKGLLSEADINYEKLDEVTSKISRR